MHIARAGTVLTLAQDVAADDAARRAALGQQVVAAAMRVLLIALATALVLRTGVIQFFATALSGAPKGSGGSADAIAAATAAFLVPGLRRRLLSPAAQQLLSAFTAAPTLLVLQGRLRGLSKQLA